MSQHVLLAAIALTLGTSAFAQDISGTFVNEGSTVAANTAGAPGTVSLHALLNLEFNTELGIASYSGTRHVQIEFDRGRLDFKPRGLDHTVLAHWNWETTTYVGTEGEGVAVRVQDRHEPDDSFIFLLETASNNDVLQAKIIRHRATIFGPQYEAMGTYFFPRSS